MINAPTGVLFSLLGSAIGIVIGLALRKVARTLWPWVAFPAVASAVMWYPLA